jgi:3-hydroxyacyl-[acyl-carrier-protein] dehydratase
MRGKLRALANHTATRCFAVGDPSADGHFPGNPIIPGAVLLREVISAVSSTSTVNAGAYCEIRSAKFHRPVRPGDRVEISWVNEGEEVRFSCLIPGCDRPVVTGSLRLSRQ